MTRARQLRDLLRGEEMIIAPGAYDCITARAIAHAGFKAVYMTGVGTSAAFGYPDYGLLTMSEMAGNAGRIAACVRVPVIADADTGYGNELNVVRTVREYEQRGVAGIHIEDQTFPKRCGHLAGKEVIGLEDYLVKIGAATLLQELQRTGRHPVPLANLTPSEAFRRCGADEWESPAHEPRTAVRPRACGSREPGWWFWATSRRSRYSIK